MKKGLIPVNAALFLTACIIMAGCKQATGDVTVLGRNSIYGNVSPASLQAAIDRAAAAGESIVFEHGLSIAKGEVNLKDASIVINGTVTNAALLNGAYANVTRANENAGINNSGTFIHPQGMILDWVTGSGTKVEFLSGGLTTMPSSATHIAIREFKLGSSADKNYSTGIAVDPTAYSRNLQKIYVVDKMTFPSDGSLPQKLTLTALGTVDFTGNFNLSSGSNKLVFAATSTLTSSVGGVSIPLPENTSTLRDSTLNVKVESGKNITFNGVKTTVLNRLDGPGSLLFAEEPRSITVNGGDGTIEFTKSVNNTTFVLKDRVGTIFNDTVTGVKFEGSDNISTGKITFKKTVGFGASPSVIRGDVEFDDDVVTQNAMVSLLGNVRLKNGKKINLYYLNGITLGANKSISVGPVPVLTAAGGQVEISPNGGTATLTAGAAAPEANPTAQQLLDAKTLTLGGANMTIKSGNLQVAANGIFEIFQAAPSSLKLLTTSTSGKLSVAAGGTISLANGQTQIDMGTATGNVTITGVGAHNTKNTAVTLKASGGTVILGDSTISGERSGASTALVLGNGAKITSQNLVLDNVTLNLIDGGVLSLPPVNGGHTVSLKNQAKLLLIAGGVPNSNAYIKAKQTIAAISGGHPVALGTTAADGAEVHSIAHQAGRNQVVLKGPTNGSISADLSRTDTSFDSDGN